jgi:hypothetical protein
MADVKHLVAFEGRLEARIDARLRKMDDRQERIEANMNA